MWFCRCGCIKQCDQSLQWWAEQGYPLKDLHRFCYPTIEAVDDQSQGSVGKFASDICFSSLYLFCFLYSWVLCEHQVVAETSSFILYLKYGVLISSFAPAWQRTIKYILLKLVHLPKVCQLFKFHSYLMSPCIPQKFRCYIWQWWKWQVKFCIFCIYFNACNGLVVLLWLVQDVQGCNLEKSFNS